MKSYSHIISKLFYEPLLVTPMRHAALCQLLESKLASAATPVPGDGTVTASNPEEQDGDDVTQVGSTVVIPVHGTLVQFPEDIAMSECGCDLESLAAKIDMAECDPRIKTVIYDFRTPGGAVTGIYETGRKILNSRKKTIAFTNSECCSGGLWLASQCELFYATQSSRVGSCGVYTMCMDMSKQLKQEGVKVNAVFAGKYKLLGAYFKPLADDERAILQKNIDKIYAQFKDAVEAHRVVSDENFGSGLVFDGDEAAEIGFIDGVVEDFEEVLEIAQS